MKADPCLLVLGLWLKLCKGWGWDERSSLDLAIELKK
jgi:hypothetical protein